jgi:hypothetical protein
MYELKYIDKRKAILVLRKSKEDKNDRARKTKIV